MKLFGRYSWHDLGTLFIAGCRRFPIVLLFLLITTVDAIVLNHKTTTFSSRTEFLMSFYPIMAALLSLALRLWSEEVRNKSLSLMVQLMAHALLLGGCVWLTSSWPLDIVQGTAFFAIVAVIILAVFMISFFRSKNDLPLWNFTLRLVQGMAIAFVVGLVLIAGLTLLIESFEQLFGWEISWQVRSDIYFICGLLIAPAVFLQFIPDGEEKHNESAKGLPKVLQGVVHYLFVPLLFAYILTLYAYASKILLTWTLPCGWVSWLVSTMMMGMVGVLILIYPSQFHEEKRFDQLLRRWLPIVALPLLLLMTIGIYRRVSDYGITVMRLYLITFNIWCYAVCFYLIWKNGKRLWWIPASFGAISFLVSVGPQSFANVILHKMKADLKTLVTSSNATNNLIVPFTNDDMNTWIQQQDTLKQRQVKDKLCYIGTTYEMYRLANVLDTASYKTVSFYSITQDNTMGESLSCYQLLNGPIEIPEGCVRMWHIDDRHQVISEDKDNILLEINLEENRNTTVTLSKEKMRSINRSEKKPTSWMIENEEGYLFVESFYYYGPNPENIGLEGIFFEKKQKEIRDGNKELENH